MSPKYKLAASNPGQFGYNVFFAGPPGTTFNNLEIFIPGPFVTQGSQPFNVYGAVTLSGSFNGVFTGCFTPLNEQPISSYTITQTGDTITIRGAIPASGLLFVRIHLDYGLKGTTGYTKGGFPDETPYQFSVSGAMTASTVVYNANVWKNDPGFAGLITDQYGTPVPGAKVVIKNSAGKLLATVYTDQDGWYMYTFKGSKTATYTITASYGSWTQSQKAYLKPKSVVEVDFLKIPITLA
jgi:hypothetical protein